MPSVQRVHWAKFRVAVVSVAALMILFTLLYLLIGSMLFEEHAVLYLYIPDASGLAPGSPVEVDGIVVGKVAAIVLSGSRDPHRVVRVTISVRRGALSSIPPESWAQLSVESPVGDRFVDITSVGTGTRGPGTEIIYKEQPDVFKSLDLEQFEAQLRQLDALVADLQNEQTLVGQFVVGTQMYSDLRRRLAQIEDAMRRAASTTGSVGHELYTDRLYQRVVAPLEQLDHGLAQLQARPFFHDAAQYDQARAAIADLGTTVAAMAAGPWFQSDRMYNDWNRGLASLMQQVAQFNAGPFMETSQLYDNLNGAVAGLRDQLHDFEHDPRKYLRVKLF